MNTRTVKISITTPFDKETNETALRHVKDASASLDKVPAAAMDEYMQNLHAGSKRLLETLHDYLVDATVS